jgi:hypothetical protein
MASATLREHPPTGCGKFRYSSGHSTKSGRMTNYLGLMARFGVIRMHKLKKTHEDSFERMLTLFGSIKGVF